MEYQTQEQVLHDRINLSKLVKKLDKAIEETNWSDESNQKLWIQCQGMLQKVKYARKLLRNVQLYDEMDTSSNHRDRYETISKTIDRLESTLESTNQRVALKPVRPKPLLPTIPLPPPSLRGLESSTAPATTTDLTTSQQEEGAEPQTKATEDLLLGPADEVSASEPSRPSWTLLSPPSSDAKSPSPSNDSEKPSTSGSNSKPTPAFLQNSTAVQDELTEQLALMATQLRRNAIHFGEALAKDQAVLSDVDEKIINNLDTMGKERVRLRDHRSKSWGTTWLSLGSVLAVVVVFVAMFLVIKVTRR